MYGYIYKTTNLVNGKIYIGQKKSTYFLGERYLGSGVRLKSAIKHYGEIFFKVELIEVCYSKEELDNRERFYISYYDSMNSDIGYNLTIGGDGTKGHSIWNKGLTKEEDSRLFQSEYTKQKRSKSLKKAHSQGKFDYSKMFTEEVRSKMSERAKQREHPPTTLGRICVTDGNVNKMIIPSRLEEYESKGFYKGKTYKNKTAPKNKGTRGLYPSNKKGKICINNGAVNKYIFESEYIEYHCLGWNRGMHPRRK